MYNREAFAILFTFKNSQFLFENSSWPGQAYVNYRIGLRLFRNLWRDTDNTDSETNSDDEKDDLSDFLRKIHAVDISFRPKMIYNLTEAENGDEDVNINAHNQI